MPFSTDSAQTADSPARRPARVARRRRPTSPRAWRLSRHQRFFIAWGLVGALVRLLLLPVGITSDTLAVYWRAHLMAFHGHLFDTYLVNMGAHAVHAGWLLLVQPLIGPAEALWTHPWWWEDLHGLAPQHVEAFLARPDALRAIFLLKLPYAMADLAAGIVLLALVWNSARPWLARRTWVLWMLSPAALYATMLFGRYESFPVFAVLLALLFAERDRPLLAAVTLGIAITLRTYPILFVPFFALVLYRTLGRQLAWAALAVMPFALTMLANRVLAGSYGELAAVGDYSYGGNWFAFALQPERGGPGVYLFAAAVLGLMAYLLGRSRAWWGSAPVPRSHLWRWLVLAHLAMFLFSQFSAHYLVWVMPAIALLLGRTTFRGLVPLHLTQVGAVFLAIAVLYGGGLFTGTLGGLGDTARTLMPQSALLPGAGGRQLANVAWSVFWVATFALTIPFLLATLRDDPGARARASIFDRPRG